MSKKTNTWYSIPREEIDWHPTVDNELCIGCGICVTGCGPSVFKYNYKKKKAVVTEPMKCRAGCTTCSNTCPTHAISFPPMSYIHRLIRDKEIIAKTRRELESNVEKWTI